MKPYLSHPSPKARRGSAGFTLTEVMISAVIFIAFFMAALVAIQLFALRIYTLAATKITATADSREVLNTIRDNIREAQLSYVGTYAGGTFTRAPDGTPQMGNAVAIYYPGANGNPSSTPIIYYQDSSNPTNTLVMVDTSGNSTVLLQYMTNYNCFTSEDYSNNVLTFWKNTQVIHLTMQFVQWQFPISQVTNTGAIDAYDFYRLQTRVVRRE